jgi:cob(I)alamin adenosyltransferase
MSITTRVGDKGTTLLFSGERVAKDSPRTEAYGDLDELVSVLGVARCHARRSAKDILKLQRELFVVGSELATSQKFVKLLAERVDAGMLADFEKRRETLEAQIKMPDGFIIPGGSLAGAHLDHARTIARRLERKVVGLQRRRLVKNKHLRVWLNRLSDYLWLLARHEEGKATVLK